MLTCDFLCSKDAQCNAEEDTLSAMVFGTAVLGDTVNENTNIVHRTGNCVKILSCKNLVWFRSWLHVFTRCGGVEVEHTCKYPYGNLMPFY